MNAVLRIALGAAVGAGIGFGAYALIGCRTGTCPLTANPFVAMTIWGLMGAMVMAAR
jgi:hypothetical protein